jgi:hypothetical protein
MVFAGVSGMGILRGSPRSTSRKHARGRANRADARTSAYSHPFRLMTTTMSKVTIRERMLMMRNP